MVEVISASGTMYGLGAIYIFDANGKLKFGGGGGPSGPGVTSITAASPLTGGTITTTGTIGINQADSTTDGYLSSTDWNTFDNKFDTPTGTTAEYVRGDGSLATFPTTGGGILHGTASGTDTYTVTITGPTAYNDGDAYLIRFTNGNTTGATLNINGIGVIDLYRNNDGPVVAGDISDGAEMLCVYNSATPSFQCIGTSPNSLITYVTNDDTVTITKGQPVYASGGIGDRLEVKLASNSGDATSAQTVGLVMSTSIAPGQKGFIMMQGLLDGLSIVKPVDGWADGNAVYLASTAGQITKNKQYAPNHLVYLGFVTTASPGSAGRIYVRVQNGYEMDELHDVAAQTPNNGDTLIYNSSTNLWESNPVIVPAGMTWMGAFPG